MGLNKEIIRLVLAAPIEVCNRSQISLKSLSDFRSVQKEPFRASRISIKFLKVRPTQ